MIYLDNNATTQPLDSISEIASKYLSSEYGNPSSVSYDLGKRAKHAIEDARTKVASLVECEPDEVIFTSGGTESIYSSIIGASLAAKHNTSHRILITPTEHPAVNACTDLLKKIAKYEIHTLPVDKVHGVRIDINDTNQFCISSQIYANNETGIITPVPTIIKILQTRDTCKPFFHSDTVQLIGKSPFSFRKSGLDSISVAAHKLYGPKGIGAMIIGRNSIWEPCITAGGQEKGRRGGTENVALIAAFGEAAAAARMRLDEGYHLKIKEIRDYFEEVLCNEISACHIIGKNAERLTNTTAVIISDVIGYEIVELVAREGLLISSGSACKSGTCEPSKTLIAMGYSTTEAMGLLRISFGYKNTKEDAIRAIEILKKHVQTYRKNNQEKLNQILLNE